MCYTNCIQIEPFRLTILVILIVGFTVRNLLIRKRTMNIYTQLRKMCPLNTHEIDLTGLQPILKRSSTEQFLTIIENPLKQLDTSPEPDQ
jgi:hypothetical protein